MPDLLLERKAVQAGRAPVCGIDEAGRGPWAGPVVACAVILGDLAKDAVLIGALDDSKTLRAARRRELADLLALKADIGIGMATAAEIDALNILEATFAAMNRAVEALRGRPGFALVDGNRMPGLPCPGEAIVKGDGKSASIAAASIVAKVTRDRLMAELAAECPGYGWERNAGYGTREHAGALSTIGPTVHHRRSFKPVRAALDFAGGKNEDGGIS